MNRAKEILYSLGMNVEIEEFLISEKLEDKIDWVNEFDWIVFPGGPALRGDYYPKLCPLTENLDDIKAKFIICGMGISGKHLKRRLFESGSKTPIFLSKVQKDAGFIGCRDVISASALKKEGFKGEMTGCPAFYNKNEIGNYTANRIKEPNFPKLIMVSDPGNIEKPRRLNNCKKLIIDLRKKFPNAEIRFIFHRGLVTNSEPRDEANNKLCRFLEEMSIQYVDISWNSKGFSVYDDCDMHVGFRVHSHIYNLSGRRVSILLEEDLRGKGINETFKLPHIDADGFFASKKVLKYYDDLKRTDFLLIEKSFKIIDQSNEFMKEKILSAFTA